MSRFFVLLSISIIVYVAVRYIRSLKPEQRKKATIQAVGAGVLVLLVFLTVTGKLHMLTAIGAGLLLLAKRLVPFIRYFPLLKGLFNQTKAEQGPKSGNQSTVETSLLKMILDHDSGELDGEILAGPHHGKMLSTLSLNQVLALYQSAQVDYPDSVEVLAAYIDRAHGEDWREDHCDSAESGRDSSHAASGDGQMTKAEAYAVLGLEEGATKKEIISAHRKLMQRLHPDRGGSDYLAAKINQAKDLLVSK